jgi:short-subunit dehydrogenase
MNTLAGKTAIITGGSRGIGRVTASHDVNLAISARTLEKLQQHPGLEALV